MKINKKKKSYSCLCKILEMVIYLAQANIKKKAKPFEMQHNRGWIGYFHGYLNASQIIYINLIVEGPSDITGGTY